MDILSLLACFKPLVSSATMRHFSVIVPALLTMTGRVTMLGISRWTEKGGSYRTIARFFATPLAWTELLVKFCVTHLIDPSHEFILAGDATTITKSGSLTHGIGRFFSGVLGQVVKGLEFFVFSLVDVTRRQAYPLSVKQTIRSQAEQAVLRERKQKRSQKKKKKKKGPSKPRGRHKGSLNKDKNELKLSAELLRINELLIGLLKILRVFVKVRYLALDGHFGHNQAVLMALSNDLDLISKLRKDTPLFEQYEGKYSGRGPYKKYGEQLKYEAMPIKYLKKTEVEGEIITNYYQGVFLHKSFGMPLNVVVIVKTNLKKRKVGYVILFGSDLKLGWEKLIEYYSLRFQIEFNFRDAKQHFGLEDFMNTSKTGVENAASLAFLMVSVSGKMLKDSKENCVGINDLKTHFRGVKYALETIKILQEKAEGILIEGAIEQVIQRMSKLGSIHQPNVAISTA